MITTCANMCSPLMLRELAGNPFLAIERVQERLAQLALPKAKRVYIGTDSCDYLLCRNRRLLADVAHVLAGELAITLVIPPTCEPVLDEVLAVVSHFDEQGLADELVVNDLGLLCWCAKNVKGMSLRAGRSFDKVTREARFDAFTMEGMARNRALFETPYVCQNAIGELFASLGVHGIELDTVPQVTLDLSDDTWEYSLWYPGIALSWCTTCEFAGSDLAAEQKFVPGRCACECMEYATELHGESLMKITKCARMIEGEEHRGVLSCFTGECRVVMSPQGRRRVG